ncbi:MAG TPA: hypothetical protein VG265_14150 [Gaiellaceae bacterium]|nr:hypothetical protein [Gaiellaceae bacterium]
MSELGVALAGRVVQASGYDRVRRRRAQRKQREKGVSLYVPAEELVRAGIDPDGPEPFYRVWGVPGGRVLVNFYDES